MSNNPAKYELLIKQYLRSILDTSVTTRPTDLFLSFPLNILVLLLLRRWELQYLSYDACLAFLRSVWYTADHVIPVRRNRRTRISPWAWGQLGSKPLGICACVAFTPTATVLVSHLYVVTVRRCYLWLPLAMMGAFQLSREERERFCLITKTKFRGHSEVGILKYWD